jgi:Fanconi anemia group M protein
MLSPEFEPREYQRRIAEVATRTNTLVVLPTGLGKTMIAIIVAAEVLGRNPSSKVLILAPTRPLVMQHVRTFREGIKLPDNEIATLTGTVDPGERELKWRKARMIFATPQTVYNDARNGRVSLREVALAVFDEAHRSVRDYTYTKLASAYREQSERPLILGLTASPGASLQKVNEIKKSLFIEAVEARSDESEDVRPYLEKTNVEAIRVRVPDEYYDVTLRVRELYNDRVIKLLNGGFLRTNRVSKKALLEARMAISARLKSAQASGGNKGYIYGAIMNQAQAVAILHALEMIETQGAPTFLRYLEKLRERPDKGKAITSLVKDPRWLKVEEEATKIAEVVHPKVDVMLDVIKHQLLGKPDSKVIVFTQYRDTIEDLVKSLERSKLRAERFVGQSDREGSKGMDQSTQTKTLQKFREGEFKILVSSSVGEEGIHIPDVDLVIFYEAVPSEIRYIQRRGRTGRTTKGRVVILLAEGTVDESYYYSSLAKESRMRELVRGTEERPSKKRSKNPTLMDFVS